MATKLTVSIIFLVFTLSYAQIQLDFPQRDVVSNKDVTDLPQSDSKAANIFLPTQKTQPETREIQPEINTPVDSKTDVTESVPLTFVSFRPINRHFRQVPLVQFRHGRRCGGFRPRGMVKPWLMRFNGGQIPYGNDMIGEKEGRAMEHGGVREMPEKVERFGFGSEMDIVPFRRPHYHRHHHSFHVEEKEEKREKHQDRDDDEEEEEEHHHPHHHHHHHHHHDGGFLGKIRKFLHHF